MDTENKIPRCCANCQCWDVSDEDEVHEYYDCAEGSCHRYPVSIKCIAGYDMNYNEVYDTHNSYKDVPIMTHPVTFAGDWCFEYIPSDTPRFIGDI